MELTLFFIALFATTMGSISGMGGGIIIKPLMDTVSGLPLEHINFMSGCTVLAMSVVNFFKGRKETVDLQLHITIFLAIGATIGGILGKSFFQFLPQQSETLQYALLTGIYGVISLYLAKKQHFKPLQVTHKGLSTLIGCVLGMLSSFLGIGGGALNMAVLFSLFDSPPKTAAKQSIFIIMFSQTSSLMVSLVTGLPDALHYVGLCFMILGGCGGAIVGSKLSKKISDQWVQQILSSILVAMMLLNLYHMFF